jgi:hypothetical protein
VSSRRDAALATLHRLGVDVDAAGAAALPEDRIEPLLDAPHAAALVEALGEVGGDSAGRVFARRAATAPERALRKALRRALFRLSQRGVPVPSVEEPAALAALAGGVELEGLVSAFDGRGDRLIWLLRPHVGGGTLLVAAEVHEPDGLRDVRLAEVSRKELRGIRERLLREAGLRLVPADWRVLDALVVEGQRRGTAGDAPLDRSRDYLRLRPQLVTSPAIAAAEPRSALAAAPTDAERPALLAASAELLTQPELRTWWPSPEAAAPFVDEIAAQRDSPLVLSRLQQEERLQDVLGRAAATLYPRHVVARRLEGTAYVLAETGRVPSARQALAIAQALHAGASLDDIPFLRALVQQGIGTLLATEQRRHQEERRGSLVLTPGEALTDPASSRPGRTRA